MRPFLNPPEGETQLRAPQIDEGSDPFASWAAREDPIGALARLVMRVRPAVGAGSMAMAAPGARAPRQGHQYTEDMLRWVNANANRFLREWRQGVEGPIPTPDAGIVRQLRAPQNLSDHEMRFRRSSGGWDDLMLRQAKSRTVRRRISPEDFERVEADRKARHAAEDLVGQSRVSTTGYPDGMPAIMSEMGDPAVLPLVSPLFSLKSQMWGINEPRMREYGRVPYRDPEGHISELYGPRWANDMTILRWRGQWP